VLKINSCVHVMLFMLFRRPFQCCPMFPLLLYSLHMILMLQCSQMVMCKCNPTPQLKFSHTHLQKNHHLDIDDLVSSELGHMISMYDPHGGSHDLYSGFHYLQTRSGDQSSSFANNITRAPLGSCTRTKQ